MPKGFEKSYTHLPFGCRLLLFTLPPKERSNGAQKLQRAIYISKVGIVKVKVKKEKAEAAKA